MNAKPPRKPSGIINLYAWRLTSKGVLRRDVPLALGMTVWSLPETFDMIDGPEPVTGLTTAHDYSVALKSGDFFAKPAELHITLESAEAAFAARRTADAAKARPPSCPRCHARDGIEPGPRTRDVGCRWCGHIWTPYTSPALSVAHPHCWQKDGRRRVMRVPILIGMKVHLRQADGSLVGPTYVEGITGEDIMCCDAETGVERELHAKPCDVIATGIAEKATRRLATANPER